MADQIKLLLLKKILPIKRYISTDESFISDIKDGSYYQDYLKNLNQETDADEYTFIINIDGISCCDKSTLAIWPVYLAINEIEIESRYHIDNIILAGLCVGLTKPRIEEFLIPIKKDLFDVSLGVCDNNKL